MSSLKGQPVPSIKASYTDAGIKSISIYMHLLVLCILIYLVVFLKLNAFHIRWWDESLFAVNTYEMMHNGKYFSLYYDRLPDLFNTKPPLTSWVQICFVKVLGYNELALRLPSALATAGCIIAVFVFVSKRFNFVWAWCSALVLLTSQGFIYFHTGRTADADALLSFFVLMANLFFIRYLLDNKPSDIFVFFIFISLGFAAKMYAALLFSPAYLVILVWQKKLRQFVFNPAFWSGLLFFLLLVVTLFGLRELDTPGYLHELFFKDAGRIFTAAENHRQPVFFYLDNVFKHRFSFWAVFFMIGIMLAFYIKNEKEKILLYAFSLFATVYLLVITLSITKLVWYDMPLFPCMAIVAAWPLALFLQNIRVYRGSVSSWPVILFIVAVFIYPYAIMFNQSQANVLSAGEQKLEANEAFIFNEINEGKNLDKVKVYYYGFKGSLLFYKYRLADNKQDLVLTSEPVFTQGDKVLVCHDSLKNILADKYTYEQVDTYRSAMLVRVTGIRQ